MTGATHAKSAPAVRMPAEWEQHEATWLAWPNNSRDWPGKFSAARWAFVEFIRQLSHTEIIRLVVKDEMQIQDVARILNHAHVDMASIDFYCQPLDRGWMRDISPFFVYTPKKERKSVLFGFTGWAKYANHRLDAQWARAAAEALHIPNTTAVKEGRTIVMEGGAVDVNGHGTLLATEECLLDPREQVRNPGFSRKDYESLFQEYLGIRKTLWLNAGISGDDTHGHIDDICRFVARDAVVLCHTTDQHDVNYAALEENRERLQQAKLPGGTRLQVIALPMPEPLYFKGVRLPASYANFYIANDQVLVPTFNEPNDRKALGILSDCFPKRRITGIHAVDLVWGFGTLHCLSHEEPRDFSLE